MSPNVLMLLGVTLVWGTTFPLMKAIAVDLGGVEITTVRFVLAAVCLLPFLRKTSRVVWRDGALLGGFALVSYVAQAYGLQHISSNRSAFLTSLNVLMVPLLGVVFGRGLSWNALAAALLACLGIGLMSWEGGGNLLGDGVTVLSALAYALYVIFLSQRSVRHDSRHLAATQITVMAVLGCFWMVAGAQGSVALASLPARLLPHLPALIYLGVVASAGMLFLQALAQRHVSAEKAAIVYAMEPVFAAVFGWLWLSESLGMRGACGGALVVVAMVLSELRAAPVACPQD